MGRPYARLILDVGRVRVAVRGHRAREQLTQISRQFVNAAVAAQCARQQAQLALAAGVIEHQAPRIKPRMQIGKQRPAKLRRRQLLNKAAQLKAKQARPAADVAARHVFAL